MKTNEEINELSSAERSAVMLRRVEYTHGFSNNNYKNKITDIGTWSMRNIRKIFRRNAYQQSPNNKISIPIPNQQLDNNTINNQSPQKINHINNKNSLNIKKI